MLLSKLLTSVLAVSLLSGCATGAAKGMLGGMTTATSAGMGASTYTKMALNPWNLMITGVTGAMDHRRQQRNTATFKNMMTPGYMDNMVLEKFNESNGKNFKSIKEMRAYLNTLNTIKE